MRKIVLAASLISCIALQALEKAEPPKGLWLSSQDWQELRASAHCKEDQVIYIDGQKECGEVVNVPSLVYKFGDIAFKIKDLSLIIFAPENNKVQYITHDGSSFVGSLPKEPSQSVKFSVETEGLHLDQAIDPSRTKYIILKEREARLNPKNKLYNIELQNGDHLSVQLDGAPIKLSDGHREFHLTPDEVIDLCFNGGLYGSTSKGRLGFSFLKDKYLEVHVAWGKQTLRLPWEQISHLRRQENITLLDNPLENAPIAKANLLIIKEPESIFVDNGDFEKWSEFDFEASALFADGVPFAEYDIAFETDRIFEEEFLAHDYSQIAFEPLKLFDSPEFFEEWEIAFESPSDLLTPEQISDIHYEMLAAEPITEPFPGVDLDEKAFAEDAELIAVKTKDNDYIDEDRFTVAEEMDSLDDALITEIEEEDSLDEAISLEEGDSMVYVPHEIHTLGEYTQKTHSLVRDRTLEATVLPTEQYPTLIVRMPGFFIDRHLVSNAEYAQFLAETHRRPPDHWDGGIYAEGTGHEPVVNVTYTDAKAYAAWVGKRIPTESEWIRAANRGIFNLDSSDLLKEWTSSPAYPSEGEDGDLVVIAPMMFKKAEIALIPHSVPREVITILNQNICNGQTGFRCVSDAQE